MGASSSASGRPRSRPLLRVANGPGLAPEMDAPAPAAAPAWLPEGRSLLMACARHGLYRGWKQLGLPAGSVVLVPAFVCDTVTSPLERAGARLAFYRVRPDLSPDLDHAAEVLRKERRARALLWYRYLGFGYGIREARDFCRERGLYFLEDCAHALPLPPAGTLGDLAVFSIRKVLPVTNAGALVVNNRALLPLAEPDWGTAGRAYTQTLIDKAAALRRLHEERRPDGANLAEEARQRHVAYVLRLNAPRRPVREATRRRLHDADRPLLRMDRPVAPDALSRRVAAAAGLAAIARARRRNYRAYLRHVADLALFRELPPADVPLGFSLRVPDRDAFRLRLARLGVESTTHWPDWLLPAGARRGFPAERELADHLLTLPCHQDLAVEEIERVCRAIKQVWRTGGAKPSLHKACTVDARRSTACRNGP